MSKRVKGMAAQYTEITLDEMKAFLARAFHALEPQRQSMARDEVVIELPLSAIAYISVFTSMNRNGQAASVGADAIRVGLYRNGRPLQSGKLPIVKRTQGWKDNLRDKIEIALEAYDSRAEDIDAGKFIVW